MLPNQKLERGVNGFGSLGSSARDAGNQPVDGRPGQKHLVWCDRRQGWLRKAAFFDVVDADDGDVLRDATAGMG